MRAVELCLVNHCGWTLRPDVSVVTNVIQNNQPQVQGFQNIKLTGQTTAVRFTSLRS